MQSIWLIKSKYKVGNNNTIEYEAPKKLSVSEFQARRFQCQAIKKWLSLEQALAIENFCVYLMGFTIPEAFSFRRRAWLVVLKLCLTILPLLT